MTSPPSMCLPSLHMPPLSPRAPPASICPSHSGKADVWSWGVLFAELMDGSGPPYHSLFLSPIQVGPHIHPVKNMKREGLKQSWGKVGPQAVKGEAGRTPNNEKGRQSRPQNMKGGGTTSKARLAGQGGT